MSNAVIRFRVYVHRDSQRQWRWTVRHAVNGKTIGASSEAYKRRGDAIKNLKQLTGCLLGKVPVHGSFSTVAF
jgi:uncharacterized protein YegP (UPF0339 family)